MRQVRGEPDQAFSATIWIHAALTAAVVVYVIVGEVMRWSDPEFDGYVFSGGEGTMWLLRGLFVVVGSIQALLGVVIGRMADRETIRDERVDASMLATRLQARQISRAASLEAIGVFGLILYVLGGERADLYGFCAVSLIGLILVWPRRAVWEVRFRDVALKHPTVPSDPWQPQPSPK